MDMNRDLVMAALMGQIPGAYNPQNVATGGMRPPAPVPAMSMQPPQSGLMGGLRGMGANFQNAGGLDALMGNPMFGAGMGLLSAGQGGNPWQGALAGMYGSQIYKQRKEENEMKLQEYKLQQQQAEAQQKLMESNRREATKLYQTFDAKAKEDGTVDPWEQSVLSQLQTAIETGENFTEVAKQMKPEDGGKPLSTMGKLVSDLNSGAITLDQFNQEIAIRNKPLVTMPDQPIGTDAPKWRNADGQSPSPLMSPRDAVAAGFKPVTSGQVEAATQAGMYAPALGAMMGFGGIGTDRSLFSPDGANLGDRAIAAASARIKAATSDPNSPELLSYTTFKDATLSGLARLVGQVGALTERDVQSVASLWPTPGLDTEGVAATKFRNIVTLLKTKGVGENYLKALGVPSQFLGEHSAESLSYESEGPP